MRRLVDSRAYPVINYGIKQKMVEEARNENPFEKPKDLGVDYRFGMSFILIPRLLRCSMLTMRSCRQRMSLNLIK